MKTDRRKRAIAEKRARKAQRMKDNPKAKSKYGRKLAFRKANCGGAPLPFFPDVMMIPVQSKPWGAAG